MPFVNVHMWTGRTLDQKRRLLAAITEAMVEHAGAEPEHLHVTVQEYELENWARAGVLGIDQVVRSTERERRDGPAGTPAPAPGMDAEPERASTGCLHHLLLKCGDLEASVRFYVEVVGVRVRSEGEHRDGRPLVLTHNGIGLTTSVDASARNLDHLAFPVASVSEVVERAKAAGAELVRGPGLGPYGHTAYVRDPDGNEVELIEMPLDAPERVEVQP